MRFLLLVVAIVISSVAQSQEIMEMKIDELESFIKSKNTPVVVNFWATWCGPCIEEMPWFNKIVPEYRDKKAELIFVSLDSRQAYPNQIKSLLNGKQIKGTFIWLNETNADVFCPRIDADWGGSIPATMFVDNSKGYRKFIESQITPNELRKQLRLLHN